MLPEKLHSVASQADASADEAGTTVSPSLPRIRKILLDAGFLRRRVQSPGTIVVISTA
jgi:hypothetical protein